MVLIIAMICKVLPMVVVLSIIYVIYGFIHEPARLAGEDLAEHKGSENHDHFYLVAEIEPLTGVLLVCQFGECGAA
jgi:hypothetical protein